MDKVEGVVQVTGLEVVRHTGILGAAEVVNIGVSHSQRCDTAFQAFGFAVIADNDAEPVAGVINVAGGAGGVENQIILFTAASEQNIDRGNILAHKSQLRAQALLHGPHGPDVVHNRGNRNGNFNSDEDPGLSVDFLGELLSRNDAVDTKGEIDEVHSGSEDGENRNHAEDVALPAAPDVGVVALVKSRDLVAALNPLLGENRRGLSREQVLQTLVALVLFKLSADFKTMVNSSRIVIPLGY